MKELPIDARVRVDCENCPGACKVSSKYSWVVETCLPVRADPTRIRVYCEEQNYHFGCPREHVHLLEVYCINGNELTLEHQ